jgi:predicted transcriptional regulator
LGGRETPASVRLERGAEKYRRAVFAAAAAALPACPGRPAPAARLDAAEHIPYIRNIPNMKKAALAPAELRFVENAARLLIPWGVPQAAARLYGYLLLRAEPVSLDRITEDLEISKSSASVAARLLESYRLAERHGERGSKRALYAVSENYEGMLAEQNRLLDALADLLDDGAGLVAAKAARARLDEMAQFYRAMRLATEAALERWRARKPRA